MVEEIWKDISGYEGLYAVSSKGRIKSYDKIVYAGRNKCSKRVVKGKILKLQKVNGYWQVKLCKEGQCCHYSVHRLVAEAFIPNPDPIHKTQVGHKDEKNLKNSNECNNSVENLEWVTPEENCNAILHRQRLSGENNWFYGKTHTQEEKEYLRKINLGKEGYWKNRAMSAETKEKMSRNHANVSGENNPMYGKNHSNSTKEKISLINSKKVFCDGKVFDKIKDCADYYKVGYTHLCAILAGKVPMKNFWKEKNLHLL